LKLLLDTHVLLWGIAGDRRLPAATERMIRSEGNDSFVSVASLWEIEIKMRQGKLVAPDDLPERLESDPDFAILAATVEHVWRVRALPLIHSDPFDRLLAAQAMAEGMTLVTHDRRLAEYGGAIALV
jgi:PIN domain nuclease of toxin-antitoxin system